MYCGFYGFSEKPFHITPNPRFLYLSKNHKEAFAHLLYGIDNHAGFIELTGEVGTGKTTVLRTLLEQLDEGSHRTALIFNPCLSALELLRNINREFGIPGEGLDNGELLEELNRFLLAQNREGRTVVLVIDEAQNLEPQVMEQIRLLSNLETESDKLIQIVLAGQPELARLLARAELRQLAQRITVRYHLRPLDHADTRAYMEHRLAVAGGKGAVSFTPAACHLVYRYSGGSPRLINLACDRALLIGYTRGERRITARMAAAAMGELLPHRRWHLTPRLRNYAALSLSGAALLVLLAALSPFPGRPAASPRSATETATAGRKVAAVKPAQPSPAPAEPVVTKITAKAAPEADSPWRQLPEGPEAAFNAVARLWRHPPVHPQSGKGRRASLPALARGAGLDVIPFRGRLATLLRLDAPAILEVKLPGRGGNRYLAITGAGRDRVKVAPVQGGRGDIPRKELETSWTGRGYIPWKNHQGIPPALAPDAAGVEVIRLQILLSGAGYFSGEPTGIFDEATAAALKAFQKSRGLGTEGRPGALTLLLLYRDNDGFFTPRLGKGG